jgi:outer membrane protein OmpA-like peptidoglycan-associated protein
MKALYTFLVLFIFSVSPILYGQEEEEQEQEEQQTQQQVQSEPKLSATSKYDFVPGESLMFYDDFSQDNVGDFPALWNTNGSGEVVTTNLFQGKWFKLVGSSAFIPDTKKSFPENYTVEFELVPIVGEEEAETLELGFYIYAAENPADFNEGGAIPGKAGIVMSFRMDGHSYSTYADGEYVLDGSSDKSPLEIGKKSRLSFWVQKTRVRAYVNDVKIFDLPKALTSGMNYNVLRFQTNGEALPLLTGFRVAVGAPDMRNKLITEGKLVTYGIYFDSGSDKIKPESAGTMKEIATVLTDNPTVNVKIVGHTDSDGEDAKNLDLSKRRAIAVKNAFSTQYGIDALRIQTDGKGETEPLAPNTTSDGKARNRRVELIKL